MLFFYRSSTIREDREVRLKALDLVIGSVLNLADASKHDGDNVRCGQLFIDANGLELLISIIRSLLEFDNDINSKKQRYYNDSLHHRIKNRILQSLLILQYVVSSIGNKILMKTSSSVVFEDKKVVIRVRMFT